MATTTAQRTNVTGERTDDGFHKATYSQGASNCVEVREGATTGIRDTQNRDLGHLDMPAGEWTRALVALR